MERRGGVTEYTPYQANRACLFSDVLALLANCQITRDEEKGDFKVPVEEGGKFWELTVDKNFMRGLGHIAFGLYMDLKREGHLQTGNDILNNGAWKGNGAG